MTEQGAAPGAQPGPHRRPSLAQAGGARAGPRLLTDHLSTAAIPGAAPQPAVQQPQRRRGVEARGPGRRFRSASSDRAPVFDRLQPGLQGAHRCLRRRPLQPVARRCADSGPGQAGGTGLSQACRPRRSSQVIGVPRCRLASQRLAPAASAGAPKFAPQQLPYIHRGSFASGHPLWCKLGQPGFGRPLAPPRKSFTPPPSPSLRALAPIRPI